MSPQKTEFYRVHTVNIDWHKLYYVACMQFCIELGTLPKHQ